MHLHSTAEAVLGHLEKWLSPVPLVAASRPAALQANARWLATSCRCMDQERQPQNRWAMEASPAATVICNNTPLYWDIGYCRRRILRFRAPHETTKLSLIITDKLRLSNEMQ